VPDPRIFTMDRILVPNEPDNLNDTTWSSIIEAQALFEVLAKDATGHDKSWDETTYESIDRRHYGESFKKLSNGCCIQISKYTNDQLPTK
jgi:hypothetical protein